MKIRLVYSDGSVVIQDALRHTEGNKDTFSFPAERIGKTCLYVDFLYDFFTADAGDPGYFVLPLEAPNGVCMTRFTPREDTEYVSVFSCMSCYGWNRGTKGILGIITGMACDYVLVAGVKDGKYYAYPRFYIDEDVPCEDIAVRYVHLEQGDYSAMAREYRRYQLEEKGCVPLRDRIKEDPRLKKSADAMCIRVRQGWKPVPAPVEEQTPENEPPMHVACTFERVGDIARTCKEQGVQNAEFCLVGWNSRGHDGRFPQIFPVEESLGGEEGLRKLIGEVKELGYNIVCHDSSTAAYRIADCWDEEYILKNKDGSLYKRPKLWAGGRPYKICPQRQYEQFELDHMEKLAGLGFEGIHYIDVMTILELLKCYDPNHPCTRKDSAHWYRKTMKLARRMIGGFSSEGSYDFAASDLDYVLYCSFRLDGRNLPPVCDESIPFWQIVYHGIILYNPGTFTLNYSIKNPQNRLKYFEYGGRPLAVFYANFHKTNHWMGLEDLVCDTDEELALGVSKVKEMAEDYALLESVRYEFMESHEKIADGVYRTTYGNGTSVVVDYHKETVQII